MNLAEYREGLPEKESTQVGATKMCNTGRLFKKRQKRK